MKIQYAPKRFVYLDFLTIEVLECSLKAPDAGEEITEFEYSIALDNRLDEVDETVEVMVDISICDQVARPLGTYKVRVKLEVGDLDKVDWHAEDSAPHRSKLTATWNSIAISTVRGMMFSDFRGTFLHHAILPIVNPSQYGPEARP